MRTWARLGEALKKQLLFLGIETAPGILHCELEIDLFTVAPIGSQCLLDTFGPSWEEAD